MPNYCSVHWNDNCIICKKDVQPSTQTIPVAVNATIQTNGVPVVFPPSTPPPEPKITDPTAQKMVAAANKYAQECEAVKTISEAVKQLTEVLAESKNKLKEAETNRDAAHQEMMTLLGGKKI